MTTGRSPSHSTTPSPPLSRSHPLLGSYQLSLLHSRMSHAHQPHSISSDSTSGFTLHLNALGTGKTCPPELRNQPPLTVPFSATYYDLEKPGEPSSPSSYTGRRQGASQTPWVGNVDFEQYFFHQYASDPQEVPMSYKGLDKAPPSYPGLKVAPVGQLQIIIKTATSPIKAFLVPYDLRAVPIGGRLLARESSYVQLSDCQDCNPITPTTPTKSPNLSTSPNHSGRKESLRYAFQLQFICMAAPQSDGTDANAASTSRRTSLTKTMRCEGADTASKDYYLSKSLKLVFTSSPPEKDDILNVNRMDEVVPPPDQSTSLPAGGDTKTPSRKKRMSGLPSFSPGSAGTSRAGEWEMLRRKWLARREIRLKEGQGHEGPWGISPSTAHDVHHLSDPTSPSVNRDRDRDGSWDDMPIPQRPPSRSTTPTPQPFTLPDRISSAGGSAIGGTPSTPSKPRPHSPRFARRKLRRGSQEERELSAKLRMMEMGSEAEGGGSIEVVEEDD